MAAAGSCCSSLIAARTANSVAEQTVFLVAAGQSGERHQIKVRTNRPAAHTSTFCLFIQIPDLMSISPPSSSIKPSSSPASTSGSRSPSSKFKAALNFCKSDRPPSSSSFSNNPASAFSRACGSFFLSLALNSLKFLASYRCVNLVHFGLVFTRSITNSESAKSRLFLQSFRK